MRTVAFLVAIFALSTNSIYCLDTSSMHLVHDGRVLVYSEDDRDYASFISNMVDSLSRLEDRMVRHLKGTVEVYVFSSHASISSKVFESDESCPYTGFSDLKNHRIYVTSPYDSFRSSEFYFSVPIHEFVHLLYSPKDFWMMEGIAVYLANQDFGIIDLGVIGKYSDFYPSSQLTPQQIRMLYNCSGSFVRFICENKLGGSIEKLMGFADAKDKASFLGVRRMDEVVLEWKKVEEHRKRAS